MLLEYNNIEGMILFSELSRRRIRSVNKLIRVGRTEVVVVLRVDKEKGELLCHSSVVFAWAALSVWFLARQLAYSHTPYACCSGYIDLSKRRVDPEDIAKCDRKWQKSKAVHSIMRHVSSQVSLLSFHGSFGCGQAFWSLFVALLCCLSHQTAISPGEHSSGGPVHKLWLATV